jgi:hypothetical protein
MDDEVGEVKTPAVIAREAATQGLGNKPGSSADGSTTRYGAVSGRAGESGYFPMSFTKLPEKTFAWNKPKSDQQSDGGWSNESKVKRDLSWKAQFSDLPRYVKTLGVAETPSSILVDERDRRVCSPFNHGLHPVAAHANLNSESTRGTESSFNVKNGYAFSLFLSKTTKDDKFQFVVSMDYPEGFRCSNQDDKSNLKIFQHERFYPMDIPQMFDKSPTLVRVKIWAAMEKGEIGTLVNPDGSKTLGPAGMYLLVDLTLIGYQGDKDLSIETFKVHESTVNKFRGTNLTKTLDKNGDLYWKEAGKYKSKDVEKNGVLTVTIAVFRADQRISAITFSDSGKLYVASDGKVVKAGAPRVLFEFRRVSKETGEALGIDSDRIDLTYLDVLNGIEIACDKSMVAGSSLVVANLTGNQLGEITHAIRDRKDRRLPRILQPDQQLSHPQIASMNNFWFDKALHTGVWDDREVQFHRVHAGGGTNLHMVFVCPMLYQVPTRYAVDPNVFAVADVEQAMEIQVEEQPAEGMMDSRGMTVDRDQEARKLDTIPEPPEEQLPELEEDEEPLNVEMKVEQESHASANAQYDKGLGFYMGHPIISKQVEKEEDGREVVWIQTTFGWYNYYVKEVQA